jgi:hypothetical protein
LERSWCWLSSSDAHAGFLLESHNKLPIRDYFSLQLRKDG